MRIAGGCLAAALVLAACGGGNETGGGAESTTTSTSQPAPTTTTVVVTEANLRTVVTGNVPGYRHGTTPGTGASAATREMLAKSAALAPLVGAIETNMFMKVNASPPVAVFVQAVAWKSAPPADVHTAVAAAISGKAEAEAVQVGGVQGWAFAGNGGRYVVVPRSTYALLVSGAEQASMLEVAGAVAQYAPA